jgi:hypothetical protein
VRDGWRCPDCSRAYEARIDRLARRLIAEHEQRRWMRAHEHIASEECVFCDVIRRATELLRPRRVLAANARHDTQLTRGAEPHRC